MDPSKLASSQLAKALPHLPLPSDSAIGSWPEPPFFEVPPNLASDLGHYHVSAAERSISLGPILGPKLGIRPGDEYKRPASSAHQEPADRALVEHSLSLLFSSGTLTLELGRHAGQEQVRIDTGRSTSSGPRTVLETLTRAQQAAEDIALTHEDAPAVSYRVRTVTEVLQEIDKSFVSARAPLDELRHPNDPELRAVEAFDLLPSEALADHQLVLFTADTVGRSFFRGTPGKHSADNPGARRPGVLLDVPEPLAPNQQRERTSALTQLHLPDRGVGINELEAAVGRQLQSHTQDEVLPTEQAAHFSSTRSGHTLIRPRWRLYAIALNEAAHVAEFAPVVYTMAHVASAVAEKRDALAVRLGPPQDGEASAEESAADLDAPVDEGAFSPDNFAPE